jgi:hypothetical protein
MEHLMRLNAFAAAALLVTASAPAFAGSIDISSLTTAGAATVSGGNLVLTPNNTQFAAGAGYLNQALALGGGASFDDTFTFSIASPTSGSTANGFAFFLESSTAGLAASNANLGLTAASPLAVEFYDFQNKNNNPSIGGVVDGNLVAAIQNGSTITTNNHASSYGSPGGKLNCSAGQPGANCLNNGTVWTADISYVAGKLYVSVQDGSGAVFEVINGYAIALAAGNYYTGFSGSTGSLTDSVTINSFSSSVPEPMTLGMFGAGLAALGFARGRRRVA